MTAGSAASLPLNEQEMSLPQLRASRHTPTDRAREIVALRWPSEQEAAAAGDPEIIYPVASGHVSWPRVLPQL